MTPRPIYLLASEGAAVHFAGLFPGREIVQVSEARMLRDCPPGLLLLLAAAPGAEFLSALRLAADGPAESGWLPVLVEHSPNGTPTRLLPLSLGWLTSPTELMRWLDGSPDALVLELRHVLAQVARSRHDINNPLTSAMAETQMALMDTREPALREGLETVEAQLRRIRDLVSALRGWRPPV